MRKNITVHSELQTASKKPKGGNDYGSEKAYYETVSKTIIKNLEKRRNVCSELKRKLIEALDLPYLPSDLSDDIPIVGLGLGLDSLDILEVVSCVESNFGVKMPESGLGELRSINTLVDYILATK